MGLVQKLKDWERRQRAHHDVAPVDPETWRRAMIYDLWFDHGVLRRVFGNEAEIAPGVWRSNAPSYRRLKKLKARGITNILTLRGSSDAAHNAIERAWCAELGLSLHAISMTDRKAPAADTLLQLIETFRRIERPFLFHCKSGADRTGLAAAIYLMVLEGRPVAEARTMLSMRYFHSRRTPAGVMDAVLDRFEAEGGGDFIAWLENEYDAEAVTAAFRAVRS